MAYTCITRPALQHITLDEAKKHLRRLDNSEDSLISAKLDAAIRKYEELSSRILAKGVWNLSLDAFPVNNIIEVKRCPVMEVKSIKYIDATGIEQTIPVANYRVDKISEPGRIAPAYGKSWPTTANVINAVTIEFEAGYDVSEKVPATARAAVMLMCAHWYRNREEVVVGRTATEVPQTAMDLILLDRIPNGI